MSTTRHPAVAWVTVVGAVAAVLVLAMAVRVWATEPSGAVVTRVADRVTEDPGDLVVVFDLGDVDDDVVRAAARAADATGAVATTARTGSLGMRSIERSGARVHGAPDGYLIPMVYTAIPSHSIGRILGADVSAVLGPDRVVMNEMTAGITGARTGDVIVMQSASGQPVRLTIAGVRPYEQVGSAELVFTTDVAARLGATADTRVIIYDVERAAIETAIEAQGLYDRRSTRVLHSWDAANPDDTLSTARTKLLLGEPVYRFAGDGSVSMHPDWIATNLRPARETLDPSIPIRARCHVEVVDDLKAALAEVAAAGLGGAIDVANANAYGGCYGGARFSRVSGQIGFLSRHSYGMALDTNTVSNCLGCRPQMHCDVVRIFRKHGFAWGGNFRSPDGMHFEWVGERRDLIAYPSRYCPNVVAAADRTNGDPMPTVGLDVLVAHTDDMGHDEHHDQHHAP
ncbi:MAG: hypothetical protein CL424_15400 [Acidimicrobiaceae bacterium]|nr:hypothetical protein [Acidimicrobiaceae bacterium]